LKLTRVVQRVDAGTLFRLDGESSYLEAGEG